MEEPQFVLNATTLAAIGGIMGVLTGAISFLAKTLIETKDKQIEDLKRDNLHTEETLTRDRDYWRDYVIHKLEERDSRYATQERGSEEVHGGGARPQAGREEDPDGHER